MSEVVIYRSDNDQIEVNVQFDRETVWLSQNQLSHLFKKTKQNISLHINNCFKEGELDSNSVVKESLTTASDGKKYKTKFYSLDVIISVGYRVKSQQGTQFRIWANKVLKDYLIKGYAVNERRLQESQKQLQEFKRLAKLQGKVLSEYHLETDEAKGLVLVIANYTSALDVLDDYDHQRLQLPKSGTRQVVKISYAEAKQAIATLGKQTKFEGLFGKEKDDSFKGSLENIYQTFDGKDLYKTTEEKAAHLLYFVVKNHSFTDGNKRIAAFIFVWFLERNTLLYGPDGEKIVSDSTLVALTLMIAQSHPNEKDMMVKVVVNLLAIP